MSSPGTAARWREVGHVGTLTVAVEDGRVVLGDLWALDAAQREQFMRLWCEAERQAEGVMTCRHCSCWVMRNDDCCHCGEATMPP